VVRKARLKGKRSEVRSQRSEDRRRRVYCGLEIADCGFFKREKRKRPFDLFDELRTGGDGELEIKGQKTEDRRN
jgi:hypothetical protein